MFIAELRRLQGGRSQKEYAAELQISQSTLSRLYAGTMAFDQLRLCTIKRICMCHASLREQVQAFLLSSDMQRNGCTEA